MTSLDLTISLTGMLGLDHGPRIPSIPVGATIDVKNIHLQIKYIKTCNLYFYKKTL